MGPVTLPSATLRSGFAAAYPGVCTNCEHGFPAGTLVRYDLLGDLGHVRCPPERPTAPPCTGCWTVPAVNGSCGCL